jgi:hypothetical protein
MMTFLSSRDRSGDSGVVVVSLRLPKPIPSNTGLAREVKKHRTGDKGP